MSNWRIFADIHLLAMVYIYYIWKIVRTTRWAPIIEKVGALSTEAWFQLEPGTEGVLITCVWDQYGV